MRHEAQGISLLVEIKLLQLLEDRQWFQTVACSHLQTFVVHILR